MARNTTVEKIVKDTLGITELKPEQQEAVELLLDGKNVFVTLPTGYGKSAIYQVLPLCTQESFGAFHCDLQVIGNRNISFNVSHARPSDQAAAKRIA